ncbi:hypothetical protein BpHYR1_023084 [Brachionus plicatilis]|uniref:Uncharacterized protein n=1 Tax=Brachionus plicatilis TaxID=10195 RepID=A0A3M7QUY3_BRAPC|nr:hypothetical protein BpHYR1_023084 [Brachionus plicatilis]
MSMKYSVTLILFHKIRANKIEVRLYIKSTQYGKIFTLEMSSSKTLNRLIINILEYFIILLYEILIVAKLVFLRMYCLCPYKRKGLVKFII